MKVNLSIKKIANLTKLSFQEKFSLTNHDINNIKRLIFDIVTSKY